jgi:hypothetical protein
MPPTNEEFGKAVRSVLQWMGCSAESAGPLLGIKPQTLNAMGSGIVPMRSLVIRFGEEVSRRAPAPGDTPEWWRDVDAWLAIAGYPPRRDLFPRAARPAPGGPPCSRPAPGAVPAPPGHDVAAEPSTPPREPIPAASGGEDLALHYYRPRYERLPWAGEYVHIFWLYDRNDTRTHMFRYPAPVDYRRHAQRLKHDLATMSRGQFERRYAGYRLEREPPAIEEAPADEPADEE